MENKIIICKGNTVEPARFWSWAVCKQEEYTEIMKQEGWVVSECEKYLTNEQKNYLTQQKEGADGMEITKWSLIDAKTKKAEFNHIQDGWVEGDKPMPIKPEFKNQLAWQNHDWEKEFSFLENGKVVKR